jgi:hypothetical protein
VTARRICLALAAGTALWLASGLAAAVTLHYVNLHVAARKQNHDKYGPRRG